MPNNQSICDSSALTFAQSIGKIKKKQKGGGSNGVCFEKQGYRDSEI